MILYNTLTRRLEPLVASQGVVKFYSCGPTVYDFAHIGNLRTFIYQDLLKRTLELAGYRVKHVMNITDVDDKTIAGARREGQSLADYTRRFADAFFEDLSKLNVKPATTYTHATKYIPPMVALIKKLLAKGLAYRKDGSVYFAIEKSPRYGQLAHLDKKGLKSGARVNSDEYGKENPADFALWKAWTPDDGDVFWETELGKGRPGWHIECSAMSMNELGETIDIHAGAVDLIFPHHENEIAQSEGATGKTFVKHWFHAEHLLVNDTKMSKSLGNEYTLRDIEQKHIEPLSFRYLVLQSHYRSKMNFTWDALVAAATALANVRALSSRDRSKSLDKLTKQKVEQALYTDLDTPRALAILHESGNFSAWRYFDRVLGLDVDKPPSQITNAQQQLIQEREEARKRGDFAAADRLRQELTRQGLTIEDTPAGPRVITAPK